MDKSKNCFSRSDHSPSTANLLLWEFMSSSRNINEDLEHILQNKESRWVIKQDSQSQNVKSGDNDFISINKCYEYLIGSKRIKTQTNIEEKDQRAFRSFDDQALVCFCGKKYKLKYTFLSHIRENHNFSIDSLAYLHNKQQLQQKMIEVPQLQIQKKELVDRIRQSSFNYIMIPEELMSIISSQQKVKIIEEANQIIKSNYSCLEKMNQNDSKHKRYCFSISFRQSIRKIAISCVQMFDRRVSIYLKNANFNSVLHLFVFNLFTVISETYLYRNNVLIPWSAIIEKGCIEFLKWLDKSYITIFQRNSIFHQHIQLAKGERFTQKERVYKKELFTHHYLQYLGHKQEDKLKLKTMEFVFNHFVNWAQEKIQ